MSSSLIPISTPGVYLFQKPAKLSLQVNRELLVVFAIKKYQTCGITLYSTEAPLKVLFEYLDKINQQIRTQFEDIQTKDIRVKLFGLSAYPTNVVSSLNNWLKLNQFKVTAQDMGRSITRNVFVDCASTKVGVLYTHITEKERKDIAS